MTTSINLSKGPLGNKLHIWAPADGRLRPISNRKIHEIPEVFLRFFALKSTTANHHLTPNCATYFLTGPKPIVFLFGLMIVGHPAAAQPVYLDPGQRVEARVADLLGRMTLDEKIGQITQVERDAIRVNIKDIKSLGIGSVLSGGGQYPQPNTAAAWADMVDTFQQVALSSRLKIPLIYGVDAVHGHGSLKRAVIFPHNIGLGAANDEALVRRIGRVTALETKATGVHWNFAPMIGLPQDYRWGRTYEGYGERTDLVARLGSAYLQGLQTVDGHGLEHPWTVLGTPKHYIGDGAAKWGTSPFGSDHIDRGQAKFGEQELRTVYLPPYRAAVTNGARSIMVSFSSWGGLKMHEQRYLLTDVLKAELGFSGFLVSDWGALDELKGSTVDNVSRAINAGLDMIMVPTMYQDFVSDLKSAIKNEMIPQTRIDDAVRRILRVKFEMGLFERPLTDRSLQAKIGMQAHRDLAAEAAGKSLVALKNANATLPLDPKTATIYVAGRAADNLGMQCGGWTLEWQGTDGNHRPGTTILDGLKRSVAVTTKLEYSAGGDFRGKEKAALGIAVVGEMPYAEWHGDRADLNLSDADKQLIRRLRERSAKLLVILISGRPLVVSDELALADAFVAAWLPGSEGQGVTDVLFGKHPFQGRLPYTWPRSMQYFARIDLGEPQTAETVLFPYGFQEQVAR